MFVCIFRSLKHHLTVLAPSHCVYLQIYLLYTNQLELVKLSFLGGEKGVYELLENRTLAQGK